MANRKETLVKTYEQKCDVIADELDTLRREIRMLPSVEITLDASELATIAEELYHKDPALAEKLWKQIDAAQNEADEEKIRSMGVIG